MKNQTRPINFKKFDLYVYQLFTAFSMFKRRN